MKSLILLTSVLCCPFAFGQSDETPIGEKFFTDIVQPIVDSNCKICHNSQFANANVVLETLDQILMEKDKMIERVSTGSMPFGNPSWKDTDEATILLYWLNQQ